ncbi:23S rRNA (guanosine(2251)-2'-O)-methyltransferase RlmB [bacterium]|nr:MAG: 23S rRNA (guanosine(2251)-2'-O)-methyltransferase RlmB [bacterium]
MSENQHFFIYGRNPIIDKLNQNPDQVAKVYIKEGLFDANIKQIQQLCTANKIPVSNVPPRKLIELVGKVNDQGVVAMVSPISYQDYEEWREKIGHRKNPFIIVLSEIEDTGNFGAILRTAAAASVDAILIPKHRQVPVTAGVVKASAGTAGIVPLVRISNVNQTLSELKDLGFWVAGLEADAEATIWEHDYKRSLALVMGSEGRGLKEATLKLCDLKLSIPMSKKVESLNVSVATGLILYEVVRQRRAK